MEWSVPLFEPDLGEEEIEALTRVIRSKWLTMGDRTMEFERRFAEFVGSRNAIAVSNCTTALHLALLTAGVRPGDQVVCPALTFVATANAIRYCRAQPSFADLSSLDDWNVSRETIEAVLTPQTRVILVVHYAGYLCDMPSIRELARERGLAIVEDAAHAVGAARDGVSAGAWGDAAAFSFFSNKNMTTGEGGMITTDSDEAADLLRRLRSHGMTTQTIDRHRGHAFSYDVVSPGYNYRMSELNAALGLTQLERLPGGNARRERLVARYRERLRSVDGVAAPFEGHPGRSAYHIMPVLLPEGIDRGEVMQALRSAGIQTSIHYRPVDTFTEYEQAGLGPSSHLERTHVVGRRELTLPLFPSMTTDQVELVCSTLSAALSSQRVDRG